MNLVEAQSRREALYALLSRLPPRDRPVGADIVEIGEQDGYRLEILRLDLNSILQP